MQELGDEGYPTPEQAACAEIPPQFVTVVGVEVDGDTATVWLLTNDQPPFEDYQVGCVREDGLWRADYGFPFNNGTPEIVLRRARACGWCG